MLVIELKGLLIGNGLNLTNDKNNFLKIESIYGKFKVNLIKNDKLYKLDIKNNIKGIMKNKFNI